MFYRLAKNKAKREQYERRAMEGSGSGHSRKPETWHIMINPNISYDQLEKFSKHRFEMFRHAHQGFINWLRSTSKAIPSKYSNAKIKEVIAQLEVGKAGQQAYHLDMTVTTDRFCQLDYDTIKQEYLDRLKPFTRDAWFQGKHVANYAENARAYSNKKIQSFKL